MDVTWVINNTIYFVKNSIWIDNDGGIFKWEKTDKTLEEDMISQNKIIILEILMEEKENDTIILIRTDTLIQK